MTSRDPTSTNEDGSRVADPETWAAVDEYLAGTLGAEDPALRAALATSEEEGLPAIQVSPLQGKLLLLLGRMIGARTILEVGTLGGYSTIWLARAAGDAGRVITLEIDPHHARVARTNLDRAGVAGRVDLRVDASIPGTRRFHELLDADPRLDATVVQTVGSKGYDGFALALVRASPSP